MSVKHWSHHDDFTMSFTNAVLAHLIALVPNGLLDVANLRLYCQNSYTTTIWLHFLFDVNLHSLR